MRAKNETGVTIEAGAQDWQVFQQNKAGVARISLRGRWRGEGAFTKAEVVVRVVQEWPFAIRDSQGAIPLRGCTVAGKDKVRLSLARPMVGAATVVGAPTANPSFVVPFDVAGYLPMLAFRIECP